MTTINTRMPVELSAASLQEKLPLLAQYPGGITDTTRFGLTQNNELVRYSGCSWRWHPNQTKRAADLLRTLKLITPEQTSRGKAIRVETICASLEASLPQRPIPNKGQMRDANTRLGPLPPTPVNTSSSSDSRTASPRNHQPLQQWPCTPRAAEFTKSRAQQLSNFHSSPILHDTDDAKNETRLLNLIGTSETRTDAFVALKKQVGGLGTCSHFINDLARQRYVDIPTARETLLYAPDGIALAGNQLSIDGHALGLAFQYPTQRYIEPYMETLLDNGRASMLVVLASDDDIRHGQLPEYFSEAGTYGHLKITSNKIVDAKISNERTHLKAYELAILNTGTRQEHSLPVLHVNKWPDLTSLTLDQFRDLIGFITFMNGSAVDQGLAKADGLQFNRQPQLLPAFHCKAGVGRTGMILAGLALSDPNNARSVEHIVTELRRQRAPQMVQTDAQLALLCQFANELGKPIFIADENDAPFYVNTHVA